MTPLAERAHFSTNLAISEFVNTELNIDGYYHPNLGGISRGGMANHYPMTILSMHELGASDDQIRNFKQQWPRNRALIDETLGLRDKHQLTAQNWQLYLGQSKKLKEFRRVFLEQLSNRNVDDVITDALNHMRSGLPMGLFHPLIRLSFAAIHGDKGLLADALAYMAIRYHDVYQTETVQQTVFKNVVIKQNHSSETSSTLALQSWSIIRDLNQKHQLADRLPNLSYGGSIHVCEQLCSSTTVQELSQLSGFVIATDNLKSSISQICRAAIQLYLSEPSLTTLHGVTASQGLVDLTHRFANNGHSGTVFSNLWQRFWVWLTALFIEKGCTQASIEPNGAKQTKAAKIDWLQLSNMALSTNEVHVIKMVYSCKWLFEQVDDDPIYKLAAQTML
jgi:hypothetical protein